MNILLADDQPRVRFALRILLEQQSGWKVTGEAQDTVELLNQVERGKPDLVLLDGELPGLVNTATLETIRAMCPDVCIIAFSKVRPIAPINAPIQVEAFASKTHAPDHLLSIIKNCFDRREEREECVQNNFHG